VALRAAVARPLPTAPLDFFVAIDASLGCPPQIGVRSNKLLARAKAGRGC
jgi:hypothetical protein